MPSFSRQRYVAAPPETFFEVLADHRGYAAITVVPRSRLEREGEPAPNGVGAIRVLGAPGAFVREEVVAYQPPRRLAYRLISGAPVRDHLATVEVTPEGEGSRVVYAVKGTPSVPALGFAIEGVAKLAVKTLLEGISREAERRAAANG